MTFSSCLRPALTACALFPCTESEKGKVAEDDPDFYEYTRGKKIPQEGLPGFDFSDPDHIVEFTK